MYRSWLEAVRHEASGERALDSVRDIARFHRIQASPGYDRASEWLCDRLEAFGLSPDVETVPGDGVTRFLGLLMPEGWECSRARAALVAGTESQLLCDEAEALAVVQRSTPAHGRFRLIAIEDGAPVGGGDVRGAMVLVKDGVHDAHREWVLGKGAAGLLCDGRRLVHPVRDRFDDPDQIAYTSFWWAGDEPRGWGMVVSPRAGDALRERLRRGEILEVDVEIESRRFATDIPLVSAVIPGESGREVLVLAHLCHPKPSANDNASGAAALLETARVLRALVERGGLPRLAHGIRFLWMPELTGTLAWLGLQPSRCERLIAALNLDMVGEDQDRCGSTMSIEAPPCFTASFAETLLARIRHDALDWALSYSGEGHVPLARIAEVPYSGGSDHAALLDPSIGVPCPMMIQWPDRFYHSSHDTPDKCDPRSLALAVRCAATYAAFLASGDERATAWLGEAVAREARVRLLRALDERDAPLAVARERVRAASAIESLARLGVPPARIADARRAFVEFAAREATVAEDSQAPSQAPGAGDRPRRVQRGMLDFLRHRLQGWDTLTREEREAWRALERSIPGASTVLDLAWFACDGRRTVGEIAALVRLETGREALDSLITFFRMTERLGITARGSEETACSTSAHVTDMP